jgi:DNA-binding transcriptional LysR family regulator
MMSTHKLRHALALAEHGNFRKAAEALNLTQPALSRSIQSLERALGARLFDRSRGGVETTRLGRVVVDRAREILLSVAELEREVELFKGLGAGTLAVSLGPYPSALSGKPAVARFSAAHPEVQCRIRVAGYAEVAADVARGRCDLGVADLEVASERGLNTEIVADRNVYFLARPRHPVAAQKHCALEQLLCYPWAGIRVPKRVGGYLPEDVGRAGQWDQVTGEFVPALEVDVVSDLLVLAHESDILVGATLTMAEEDLEAGKLAVVQFSKPWLKFHYGFISRPNHTLSPATLRFMEIVRDIEAELDEREAALRKRYL